MRSPRSVLADPGEGSGSPTLRIPPAFFAKFSRSMNDATRAPVFRVFPGDGRHSHASLRARRVPTIGHRDVSGKIDGTGLSRGTANPGYGLSRLSVQPVSSGYNLLQTPVNPRRGGLFLSHNSLILHSFEHASCSRSTR